MEQSSGLVEREAKVRPPELCELARDPQAVQAERRLLSRRQQDPQLSRLSAAAPGTGGGKTGLLRSWVTATAEPVAWVTVERGERDAQRFSGRETNRSGDDRGFWWVGEIPP